MPFELLPEATQDMNGICTVCGFMGHVDELFYGHNDVMFDVCSACLEILLSVSSSPSIRLADSDRRHCQHRWHIAEGIRSTGDDETPVVCRRCHRTSTLETVKWDHCWFGDDDAAIRARPVLGFADLQGPGEIPLESMGGAS